MNKKLLFLVISISLFSCKEYEEIQFLGLKEVKVNGIKEGNLLLSTKASFNNPNNFKGKLKSADIYVLFKGDTLAHISHIEKIAVAPSANFDVPLSMEISMDQLQKGLLSNLSALFKKKSVELTFTGNIKVASFGFTQTIPVNYKEEIEF
ncbi:MAG: LEA type 2 family protein [Cyclobacteriaceae bacterium]|nr:LEA type 2 family protein [Cyclobacteriaceae bacterium]